MRELLLRMWVEVVEVVVVGFGLVCVVGVGHLFSGGVLIDGMLLWFDAFDCVLDVDGELVCVEVGICLHVFL